jgi:protein-tyrosine phosphatase
VRILFVCLGNICRSPTAHAATLEALIDAGVANHVELDSAGIGDWHIGRDTDERMRTAADADGLTLHGPARQVTADELAGWDLILAMDHDNLAHLRAMAHDDEVRARIRLFRDYDPDAPTAEVPDPYYGGSQGFSEVVRICRAAAVGLTDEIVARLDAGVGG